MTNLLERLPKQAVYYWRRWRINRQFKKREEQITYGTFIQSFFDMDGAMTSATRQYSNIVELRYYDIKRLNKEYQKYFTKPLKQ